MQIVIGRQGCAAAVVDDAVVVTQWNLNESEVEIKLKYFTKVYICI